MSNVTSRLSLLLPLALPVLLSACTENNINRSVAKESFQQAPSNLVDILWIIDNSSSMIQEQESVALGADAYASRLAEADVDLHLGVISTDLSQTNPYAGILLGDPPVLTQDTTDYVEYFKQRVQMGIGGDDAEKGLQAALTALTPPLTQTLNVGFLREDAMLSIVIVSDENDCSDDGRLNTEQGEDCYHNYDDLTPVPDLVERLLSLKAEANRVTLSGIIGPDIVDNCEYAVPGTRYSKAIAMLGGFEGDICQADYGRMMDSLGTIAAGIYTSFALEHVPDPETIEVVVRAPESEEVTVPEDGANGWTYNNDPTAPQIEFHGTAVPVRGSEITVTYTVAGAIQDAVDSGA